MRKIPFILCVLITASVLLFGLKVFAILYESMPKIEHNLYRNRDFSKLINDLMFEDNGNALRIYWTDSMEKLVKSGILVVPDLINAIESAHEKAASVKYADGMEPEELIKQDTEMLQIRAAMVLGKIGDARAIPVLKSLHCLEGGWLCHYVNEALKSIEDKEQQRLNPKDTYKEVKAEDVEESKTDNLIKKLWSANDEERRIAKNKLVGLGQKAVRPLISLLNDVTEKNEPRFVLGKEKEGAELMAKYRDMFGNTLSSASLQNIAELQSRLREVEISWRLKSDSIELLCRLKAEEAVPILIKLLKETGMVLSKKNEEIKALSCFASLAVPKLIEEIEAIRNSPSFIASQKSRQRNFREGWFLIRLLRVMKTIGDHRALDSLEKLSEVITHKEIRAMTIDVIKTIKRNKK